MGNSSDYYYDKGLNFLNNENYDEALMYLDKAIDMEPDNIEYLNRKAICLYKLNLDDEAIVYFDKILEIDSEYESIKQMKAELLAIKAKKLQDNNFTFDSIKMWDEVLNLNPNNAEYLNNKSQVLFDHAMIRNKISDENNCDELQINSRVIKSYHNELNASKTINDIESSFEIVNEAIDYDGNLGIFLFEKGKLYYKIGNYDEAIECYDKAIELDPTHKNQINTSKINCLMVKARSLEQKGRYDDAIEFYDNAIEINNLPNLWGLKGNCLYLNSQYEESIECYTQAYEVGNIPVYLILKTRPLIELKLFEKALDCINEAQKLDSDKNSYDNFKIGLLIRLRKYEEAKEFAEEHLDFLSKEKRYIGEIEDLDNALDCINNALKLEKNNSSYLNNKKNYLYHKAKRLMSFHLELASDVFDELIELDSNIATYWESKGIILTHKSKYKQARECFINALKLMNNEK